LQTLAGGIGDGLDVLHALGIHAVFSLCREPMTLAAAERDAEALLAATAEQVVRGFFARR
jgi:glycerate 2-kinase